MQLNGRQLKQFHDALLSAFPTPGSLARMVSFELDENLSAIAGGQDHSEVVFGLLQWAQSRGQLEELAIVALNTNSDNPDLCEFARQLQLLPANASTNCASVSSQPESLLDDNLLQQVHDRCCRKILNRHSHIKLLSGAEIGVDQLYVDVWLLNRSPRTFQVSPSKLLKTFDLRNDRLGLGSRIQRLPGFEVANTNAKLVILGKPGSGKTTFLKHLAIDWCKHNFQPDLITVFIEFRRIRDEKWQIQHVLNEELELEKQQVMAFLSQGKLLLLMDGLDELPTVDLRQSVQKQIEALAEKYPKNRFVLTCRTQTMMLLPEKFTSVEVADFNREQVRQFVHNWFMTSNDLSTAQDQWEKFQDAIRTNLALNELTVTPVLLSLMCLILQDEGEIPSQVTWLYYKGIKLLLNKWNDTKDINGWEIGNATYEKLSVEQREELLIKIAARKFEEPKNFVLFEQEEIATDITRFLHLANSSEGVAVLKAIEARHGLLIERADELWSFSHLTFQEYFTVQWLTKLSFDQLAEKIANYRWQEVVKQLVKSQQPADQLVRLIKQAIDRSIAGELKLQEFLAWIQHKSNTIRVRYKPSAVRAFYFTRTLAPVRTLAAKMGHDIIHTLTRTRDLDFDLDLDVTCDYDLTLTIDPALARSLSSAITRALTLDRTSDLARSIALDLDLDLALLFDLNLDLASELSDKLEQLRKNLPILSIDNWESFQQWWKVYGVPWLEQLCQIVLDQCNIDQDWQFNDTQKQQMQYYYNVNKFLVDLVNIKGAVSESVRAEVEDTLLLPWEELESNRVCIYNI